MRQVTLSGDVLFRKDIENARRHFRKECIFVHCFASSEAGLMSKNTITYETTLTEPIVSIGYPIEGREIWIQDQAGRRLNPGQTGRIGIRSPYISDGYWNRPEETARHFFQDPDDPHRGSFSALTLENFTKDGTLEILGREDAMVKVRGYRVELAAVEAALFETDDYRDAAVVVQPGADGEKQIAAYLVSRANAAPDKEAIRLGLAKKLPEYMLPSKYVFLDMLPRLKNGKIDRQSLQRYEEPVIDSPQNSTNAVEGEIGKFICGTLGLQKIGREDNLFVFGCSSLQAAEIIAKIIKRYQIDIPLSALYEKPTLMALAAYLENPPTIKPGKKAQPEIEADRLDYLSQFG